MAVHLSGSLFSGSLFSGSLFSGSLFSGSLFSGSLFSGSLFSLGKGLGWGVKEQSIMPLSVRGRMSCWL
jgi:uncharacterized protein YjbI with pentapeptide repeats